MGGVKHSSLKIRKINIIGSSICVLWKPIDFLDNIPKCSYMFAQLCLCSAKWIYFYCQVFQIWLLIQRVVESVVGESVSKSSVVGCLVSRWSVNLIKPRKNMCAVVNSPAHFGRDLFCYSSFNFFYIDNKEETNLIARSSHYF